MASITIACGCCLIGPKNSLTREESLDSEFYGKGLQHAQSMAACGGHFGDDRLRRSFWRCLFSSQDSPFVKRILRHPLVCVHCTLESNLTQFVRTLFSTSNKVLQSTAAYVFVDGSVAEEASNPLCLVWACVTLDEQ